MALSDVHLRILGQTRKVGSDRPLSKAGSSYGLYFNTGFGPIPPNGDTTGLVAQLVQLARREDSGVTGIHVTDHEIDVYVSAAVGWQRVVRMFQTAIWTVGRPLVLIDKPLN